MPADSLQLLVQAARKRAVQSLNTDSDKQFAPPTAQTIIPLAVAIVAQISQSGGSRVFQPLPWTGWTDVKAGIGNPNRAPVAGTWYLLSGIALTSGTLTTSKRYKIIAYVAGDNFTNVGAASNASGVVFTASGTTPTTWSNSSQLQEITADLDFDATAAEVQTALGNTAWITAAGGVTVSGNILRFIVTFTVDGSRTEMTGYSGNLFPLCITEVATAINGTVDIQEVQTVSVYQNVAALVLLDTESDPAGITIDELQAGGGGNNQKYRITLDPLPYDGSFTLVVDNGVDPAGESDFISWDASDVVMLAILESMTAIGSGNVQVVKETDGQWLVMFIGTLANTAVDVTGDASALQVVIYKLGTLNLDTAGIQLLLNGATTVSTFLAITGIPPGESFPSELLRLVITLNAAIIGTQNTAPDNFDSYVTVSFFNGNALLAQANSSLLNNSTLTIASGSTVLFASGSVLTVNGQFDGTPLSGTLDLHNLTLTVGDIASRNVTFAAGKTIKVTAGSNSKAGTFTLVAGTVTVSNSSVTANSVIVPTLKTLGGTQGNWLKIVPTATTGFVVVSENAADTSVYNYIIAEVV